MTRSAERARESAQNSTRVGQQATKAIARKTQAHGAAASRLKELRLHGFKSFADPTRFVFEPGVNAVIGPNGSGKSNMADAVRWVLGEQSNRSLRTRRADDVIFAGSDQRRAQGMAEAILTLDNVDGWLPIDFAEVTVGRRAYRSGETEYLINGVRARLRDVVELLGSGRLGANELVVVGQGTVDAALSLRPDERRQLFEEAAGVKNLQVRKNEATARLAKARDNLARVGDLVGELRPQVRRLALQAEHQQQHAALASRARVVVEESHRRRESAARDALGEARRVAAAAEAALEAHRAEEADRRQRLATAEARYWEAEAAARQAAEAREKTRETLIRAEAHAETVGARVDELRVAIERATAERGEVERALARHASTADDTELDALLRAQTDDEGRWREAVARLAEADAELLAAEDAVADLRRRESEALAARARRAEEDAALDARRERAASDLAAARDAHEAARVELEAARDRLRSAEADLADAGARLDAASAARDAAQAAADGARDASIETGERLKVLQAEAAALGEQLAGDVRLGDRLRNAGWPSLLHSLDAPDAAWPAIEAVVGGELDAALLWREADVAGQVREAVGSARFVDTRTAPAPDRDSALRAVRADRTLAEWVGLASPAPFHRAVVAPDLDALLAGWRDLPAGWCAVTAEGDIADARGVLLVRGRAEQPGGVAARRRARRRELEAAIARASGEHRAAMQRAHDAAEALRAARTAHLMARERMDEAGLGRRGARDRVDAAGAVQERVATDLDAAERLAVDAESLIQAGARAATTGGVDTDEMSGRLEALETRAQRARSARESAAAERDAAREAWSATRAAAEEAEMRSGGLRRERGVAEARLAQLDADLPRLGADLEATLTAQASSAERLDEVSAADEAATRRRAAADAEREARRAELRELERGAPHAASRFAELERAAQTTAIEASRRQDALDAIGRERELALEGLADEGRVDAEDAQRNADEIRRLTEADLDAEARRVRRTLAQIGSVNPFAVEEHRELAGRLEELTRQEDDLRAAIGSTEELIARLDAQIAEQFDAAFRAIGERFDDYCRLLFAGGSASLQMSEADDGEAPGGIEIVVRPPGKRLQRLAMLSGGERALTGVALLFAMLSVNPVPFCILDEVDAALDEANIGRFADALRRLAEGIDFVVITHNRATIEVADTIYGVTMTDAAVSRVLSLKLADVAVEASA